MYLYTPGGKLARSLTSAQRITRARALIDQARALQPLDDSLAERLTTLAQARDLLRQARDLVKFISYRPGPSSDEKRAAAELLDEADRAQNELLR